MNLFEEGLPKPHRYQHEACHDFHLQMCRLSVIFHPKYIQMELVTVGVYERSSTHVQLALQRKRLHANILFRNKHVTKRKKM